MKAPTSKRPHCFTRFATVAIAAALVFASNAHAQLLYEGFDYTGTNLNVANGGTGWTTAWKSVTNLATDSTANIGTGSLPTPTNYAAPIGNHLVLQHPGGQTVAARGIAAPARFDLDTDNTWYFSFLAEKNTNAIFMNFRQGNSTNVLSLGVSTGGEVTMTLVTQAVTSGTPLIVNNSSYLYVGKVVGSSTGGASAYFTRYLEGTALPSVEPGTWLLETTLAGPPSTLFSDRIALTGGDDRIVGYDEIRVGSTWNTAVIPEPSTFATALVGLGALALLRRRLRRA